MKLKIDRSDIDSAVEEKILSPEQKDALWTFLQSRSRKSFQALTVLGYFGALIIISSMTWFATKAFSESNPWILFATGTLYIMIFYGAGLYLRKKLETPVPSMLSITICTFMVPLTVFAVQRITGLNSLSYPGNYHDFYVWISSGWFYMEMATIVVSLALIKQFGYELLTLPLAFALWFLSMDLTPIIFGFDFDWEDRRQLSIYFGLVMIIVSYVIDLLRKEKDYSFWLYLFGLISFWCGLSFSWTDSLPLKFLYCGINIFLIAVSLVLRRVVFLVFGSLGLFLFLYDLSDNVFRDMLLFPIYLSLVGAGLLAFSIWLLKKQNQIDAFLENKIPAFARRFLPRRK